MSEEVFGRKLSNADARKDLPLLDTKDAKYKIYKANLKSIPLSPMSFKTKDNIKKIYLDNKTGIRKNGHMVMRSDSNHRDKNRKLNQSTNFAHSGRTTTLAHYQSTQTNNSHGKIR
jgi:hypothetical protein